MFNTPNLAELLVGQSDFISTLLRKFSSYSASVRVAAKRIEVVSVSFDGEQRFVFKRYYDTQGRLVRAERDGAAMTVLPFSCRYTVGKCTHDSKVPYVYAPSNDRFSEKTLHHVNRLEGRVFYFGTVLSNGSVREYPFELGKYNLRVGQEYENFLGQKPGFKLVEIVEP